MRRILLLVLAIVAGMFVVPAPAAAAGTYSFSAGVLQPGQVVTRYWTNANSDVYVPGIEASAADGSDDTCTIRIRDTYYARTSSGTKRFYLTLVGDPSDACQVRVWLRALDRYRQNSVGTLAPGESAFMWWNNASTLQNIYLVGVLPEQVPGGTCSIRVYTSSRTNPNGESEFTYRAMNIGSTSCSATLLHAKVPVEVPVELRDITPPGEGGSLHLNPSALPQPARVVAVGVHTAALAGHICTYMVDELAYQSNGWLQTTFYNHTDTYCTPTLTFAKLA